MSLIRYPGGKKKLKTQIVGRIKDYYYNNNCFETCEYVEPFFGAGAIGLSLIEQCPISKICINDADPGMSAIWTSVIFLSDELCKKIDEFVPSVDKFFEYKQFLRAQENNIDTRLGITVISNSFAICNNKYTKQDAINEVVDMAFKKIAIHQMSFSGLGTVAGGPIGGQSQSSDYKVDCRWNPNSIKKSIKKLHQLLFKREIRYKTCTTYDWSSVLIDCNKLAEQNKDYRCFVYMDPPYFDKGPELYQFYFSKQDHIDLSSCLKDFKHPWLLSYDNVEEVRDLYSWAKVKEIAINYTINTSRNNTELLIANPDYDFLLDDDDIEVKL